jgi:uncharacterized protein (TIGR03086 family)
MTFGHPLRRTGGTHGERTVTVDTLDPKEAQVATTLTTALGWAELVTDVLDDEDLDEPTACVPWTVRAVVEHLAGSLRLVAAAVRGDGAEEAMWRNVVAAGDPVGSLHAAAEELSAAASAEGLEGASCLMPEGLVPVAYALDVAALEAAVHAWDIGVAVGVPVELDPDASHRLAVTAEVRRHLGADAGFQPPLQPPVGATAFEALLASTGREPVGRSSHPSLWAGIERWAGSEGWR